MSMSWASEAGAESGGRAAAAELSGVVAGSGVRWCSNNSWRRMRATFINKIKCCGVSRVGMGSINIKSGMIVGGVTEESRESGGAGADGPEAGAMVAAVGTVAKFTEEKMLQVWRRRKQQAVEGG